MSPKLVAGVILSMTIHDRWQHSHLEAPERSTQLIGLPPCLAGLLDSLIFLILELRDAIRTLQAFSRSNAKTFFARLSRADSALSGLSHAFADPSRSLSRRDPAFSHPRIP